MLELRPIVCDRDLVVLWGNMRLRACKEAWLTHVPVIKADDLTEEQKKEFIIKDNVWFGSWDWDDLGNNWDEKELIEWGLDIPDLEVKELDSAEEDDYEIPEEVKTDIVLGDLFEIWEHRLLCGDSTNIEHVEKLMNGEKADMVFTDPPYLMDFTWWVHADWSKSFNSKHWWIKNDKMSETDAVDFLDSINSNIKMFVVWAFYICFYRLKLWEYFESLKRTWLDVRTLITWDKWNHTLSNSDYMSKCEHIFYGWVEKHNFYWWNNWIDIWEIQRTWKNELHPTMKPIPLCEKAINDWSKKGDTVLDLFLGSGSTMVASHQLKRKCYGMELDPKYCQVIIDRMKKLDPSLIVKKNWNIYE